MLRSEAKKKSCPPWRINRDNPEFKNRHKSMQTKQIAKVNRDKTTISASPRFRPGARPQEGNKQIETSLIARIRGFQLRLLLRLGSGLRRCGSSWRRRIRRRGSLLQRQVRPPERRLLRSRADHHGLHGVAAGGQLR